MNCKKLMRGVAMLCAGSILWASCKKESDTIHVPTQEIPIPNLKRSAVVPDDPARIAKVPVISSADFMADKITDYLSFQPFPNARAGGKDRTTPQVSISNPLNGALVSGTVNVLVSATDNVGVSAVVLKIDGTVIATDNTSPYNFSWNTSGLSGGTHTLSATATDAAGNSKVNTIQVGYNTPYGADITPPSVSITSPANGSLVAGSILVAVSAADNIGVTNVNLYVDGAFLASDAIAPYSFSLNAANLASGIHTLLATASDAAGNGNSNAIQVSVNTTVINPPPGLPSSFILAMPPVSNQGAEGSCVAFAVAYAARSGEHYYRNNATSYSLAGNVFSPEYVFNQIKSGPCVASSLLDALDLVVGKGVCTWSSMPYSSANGCSELPTAGQNAEAANYKIGSYSALSTSDITAMKTMLANKHPLMMAFSNDNNFNNAGPGYIWRSYDLSNGTGGHAITICGYDDAKHAYKAINSWGTSWGSDGYIWIDYDFMKTVQSYVYVMN